MREIAAYLIILSLCLAALGLLMSYRRTERRRRDRFFTNQPIDLHHQSHDATGG